MTAALPAERVADVLSAAGYRRLPSPLQVAGLSFEVAAAFVGVGHSADLLVVGDMAASGERKVIQQVEGVARALDVMRSHRPLTIVIVGPRPIGKPLETLSQLGRVLAVEEATDPLDLRDRLAVLLPLELPNTLRFDRDLDSKELLNVPDGGFDAEMIRASKLGEDAVRTHFHASLNAVLGQENEREDGPPG